MVQRLSEISSLARIISSIKIPPALLLATSFLAIILVGSGLLMMPRAHALPLSFLDSFITLASAVCVTGLVVVDTSAAFTNLGRIIILVLAGKFNDIKRFSESQSFLKFYPRTIPIKTKQSKLNSPVGCLYITAFIFIIQSVIIS